MKRLLLGVGAAMLGAYWIGRKKPNEASSTRPEEDQGDDPSFLRMNANQGTAGPEQKEIQGAGEVAREF